MDYSDIEKIDFFDVVKDFFDGLSIFELVDKYKLTCNKIFSLITYYCKNNNISYTEELLNRLYEPIEVVYNKRLDGISLKKLANEYGCGEVLMNKRIAEYCKQHNLEVPVTASNNVMRVILPMDYVYQQRVKGVSYSDLAFQFNCSHGVVRKRLIQYCLENNLKVPDSISFFKSEIILPMGEVYRKYIDGTSYYDLSIEYGCSKSCIREKIKEYSRKMDLKMRELNSSVGGQKVFLPIEEIYKKLLSGMSKTKLAKEYKCSVTLLSKRVKKYCLENDLEIPVYVYKRMELPMDEIYKMYVEKVPLRHIAKKFGCSSTLIKERIYEYCVNNNIFMKKLYNAGRKRLQLPADAIYNKYISGISMSDIAKEYECSYFVIKSRLIEYCKLNNLEFPFHLVAREKKYKISIEEIYQKRISGIGCTQIAREYGCSVTFIKKRLNEYYMNNNLEKPTNLVGGQRIIDLPIDEIYEKYNSGMSFEELAYYFHCSSSTIRSRIQQYCNDNELELYPSTPGRKRIDLPSFEVYEKYNNGESFEDLAYHYGCSSSLIRRIVKKELQKNLLLDLKQILLNNQDSKKYVK